MGGGESRDSRYQAIDHSRIVPGGDQTDDAEEIAHLRGNGIALPQCVLRRQSGQTQTGGVDDEAGLVDVSLGQTEARRIEEIHTW